MVENMNINIDGRKRLKLWRTWKEDAGKYFGKKTRTIEVWFQENDFELIEWLYNERQQRIARALELKKTFYKEISPLGEAE